MSDEHSALFSSSSSSSSSSSADDFLCWSGFARFAALRWRAHDVRVSRPSCSSSSSSSSFLLLFVCWRVLLLLLLVCTVVGAVFEQNNINTRAVHWAATFSFVTLFQQLLSALLLLLAMIPKLKTSLSGPAVVALEIGLTNSVVVTIVFWTLLAPRFEFNQFLVHGCNMLLLFAELGLDSIAFVPLHVLFVLVFDLLYFLIILLPYQSITGTVIYPGITDFAAFPTQSILALLGIGIAAIVVFTAFLFLSHIKCQYICASASEDSSFVLRPRRRASIIIIDESNT